MTFAIWFVLILGLLVGVLNILPTAGLLPLAISSGITTVVGLMKAWNFLLPITELLVCAGIVTVYYLTIWGVHALIKIYHAIRGSNQGN